MGDKRGEEEETGIGIKKKIERIKRERSNSTGKIEEYFGKKRVRVENDMEREEALRSSKVVAKSPQGQGKGGKEEEEGKEEMIEILKIMRREIAEGKEEVREVARKQEERLKKEIKELKEELRRRDEIWEEERRETRREIEKLKEIVEKIEKEGGKGEGGINERIEKLELEMKEGIEKKERRR